MTSSYDAWLSTDRAAETSQALHETFARSDEYLSAYVNYTDDFDSSSAYDKAFENWVAESDEQEPDFSEDPDWDRDSFNEPDEYYGLHPEDEPEDRYPDEDDQ